MTDEKTSADRVLDLLLFAPVGLAISARDLLPQLVERGRQQVTGQVTMARMIGQFAVKQGTVEAEKAFVRARTQAQATLEQLGVLDQDAAAGPPAPRRAARVPSAPVAPVPSANGDSPAPAPVTTPAPVPTPAPPPSGAVRPGVPELAIPAYDSLSASQVLPRLSGLSAAELEAVRAHEAAHRGRKTILSKVAQLQGS